MLDLPLLKKKKKKTGFNLDAALELTSSPSDEKAGESTAAAASEETGAAEEGAGNDFDLDMDFSKIKKKKKKTKKAIDELLPEKEGEENQEDRENGRCSGPAPVCSVILSCFVFRLHALTIPRDSS